MGEVIRMKTGNKRIFKSPEDFCKQFDKYVEGIVVGGYEEVISFTGFAREMNCSYKTVQRMLNNEPKVNEYCRWVMENIIIVGAIKGYYKSTPAIFYLKNKCGWVDKVETTHGVADKNVATKEEAKKKVEEILKRNAV